MADNEVPGRWIPVAAGAVAALSLTACSGVGGSTNGGGSDGADLVFQSYTGQTVSYGVAMDAWMEDVTQTTDSAITFDANYDGSVYNVTEILGAVTDGRLDVGHFSVSYYPGDFPLTSISTVPFITDNLPAQMAAMDQLFAENADLQAEFEDRGLHYLGFLAVPGAIATSPTELDALDDLHGSTIRGSAGLIPALEAIEVSDIVTPPVHELYESLERGVADIVVGFALDVGVQMSLHEVTPHFVDVGAGQWADTVLVMNLETWESLSTEQQDAINEALEDIPSNLVEAQIATEDEACSQLLDEGGSVSRLPEDAIEEWRSAAAGPLQEGWVSQAESAGVEDPEAFWDSYLAALEETTPQFADYQSGIARCVSDSEG